MHPCKTGQSPGMWSFSGNSLPRYLSLLHLPLLLLLLPASLPLSPPPPSSSASFSPSESKRTIFVLILVSLLIALPDLSFFLTSLMSGVPHLWLLVPSLHRGFFSAHPQISVCFCSLSYSLRLVTQVNPISSGCCLLPNPYFDF